MPKIMILCMTLFFYGNIRAGIVTWDGDANDKDWMNVLNWDGDILPAANDDVVIPDAHSVILNANTSIQSLTINGVLVIEVGAILGVFVGVPHGVKVSSGELYVAGTLNVILAEQYGVLIEGFSSFTVSGILNISQAGSLGLLNANLFNSSLITGTVNIDQVPNGLNCTIGIFTNQGTINISQPVQAVSNSGISINGSTTLHNQSNGSIDISGDFSFGLRNSATLTNAGDINIEDSGSYGLQNYEDLVNTGTITIHSANGTGIRNFQLNSDIASIQNQSSGVISISGMTSSQASAISFSATLPDMCYIQNEGIINLNNFTSKGIQTSPNTSFTNSGELNVTTGTCQEVIINEEAFTNTSDGTINIDLDQSPKIIYNTNSFSNAGSIVLNSNTSSLAIHSTSEDGIFNNSGSINIGALGMINGILIDNESLLINSGSIKIDVLSLLGKAFELTTQSTLSNTSSGILEIIIDLSSGDLTSISDGATIDNFGEMIIHAGN